jgi:hypothetical protein
VTLRGQQPQQALGDLSVPTGDQDVHGSSLRVRPQADRSLEEAASAIAKGRDGVARLHLSEERLAATLAARFPR